MKLTNHQKTIIASQAAGMIGTSVFSSGVLLSYSQFLSFSRVFICEKILQKYPPSSPLISIIKKFTPPSIQVLGYAPVKTP